jgi:hypothetical protein
MESNSSGAPASPTKPTLKSGAEIVVSTLLDLGVDTMFGYCGGVILPLFDKLYDAPIRFIVPRHEQGGCHMADGYARASGKVGVIVTTSGPGACNLVTGLATAMMDSVPLVAITGQVRTDLIGNDAFRRPIRPGSPGRSPSTVAWSRTSGTWSGWSVRPFTSPRPADPVLS